MHTVLLGGEIHCGCIYFFIGATLMVEQCSESRIQPTPFYELSVGGHGIDVGVLLRQKPKLRISSFHNTEDVPDIYLSGLRDELEQKESAVNETVRMYTPKPSTFPEEVGIEGDITMGGDEPMLSLAVAHRSLMTQLIPAEQHIPASLDRFFALLDWEKQHDSSELQKILPLLQQMHIVRTADTARDFFEIVHKTYPEDVFVELLALSRKVQIIHDASGNNVVDTNLQALFGVNGVLVDGKMTLPNDQGEINIPLHPSKVTFYSNADYIGRRELATLLISKRSNDSLVLWCTKGIEKGTMVAQGEGVRLVFAYETEHKRDTSKSNPLSPTGVNANQQQPPEDTFMAARIQSQQEIERLAALTNTLQKHLTESGFKTYDTPEEASKGTEPQHSYESVVVFSGEN